MLLAALSVHATEFYVAPNGVPTNTGTISSPWDLQTALNQPASVKPGDTIWLRNGIHRLANRITKFTSRLTGTSSAPITVRQYPGERATIDGNITQSTGGWVNYWGFEIYNSNPNRYTDQTGPWPTTWQFTYDGNFVELCVSGMDLRAPNVKLINMVVHDSIGGGFGINREALDTEMYGCISYYNGWQAPDRAHGHGLYAQNATPYTKNIKNNVFYGNLALNVQITGNGPESIADNFNVEGNTMYMSGNVAITHQQNLLLGPYQGTAKSPRIIGNFVYDTRGSGADTYIGYAAGTTDAVVQDNYFGTSVQLASVNNNMTMANNLFAGGTILLDHAKYPNNTYLSSKPTSNKISVVPNQYEAGRANIVIYNWQQLSSVTVDVSKIGLNPGDQYELHNAQNFYGDVIVGSYTGSPITIPMTGHTVAKPQGQNFATPPSNFPEFGTLVIMKKAGTTTPSNTAPVVSTVANQTINANTATSAIGFTVSDKETAATSLSLTTSSSNTTLVPNANIVLGGSGTNRTVTVTPAANQSGTATITIKVSDGVLTSSSSFTLTVNAVANTAPVISTVANQTINVNGNTGPLAFTVGDAETAAANLTVAGTSSNTTLVPNANIVFGGSGTNRTVIITPTANQSGTATITIQVKDGTNTTSKSFVMTVLAASNTAPTISPIAAKTTTQGTATAPIPFAIGDAQTAASSLTLLGGSSNPTLVPNANVLFGGSGSNRTVTVTPAAGQSGTANITVTVSDGTASANSSFALTVSSTGTNTTTNVTAGVYLGLEAEDGVIVSPMITVVDTQVPTRRYINTTTANQGTATYNVDIPKAATYVIWAKILGASYSSDSFFVSVDGQEDVFDAAENKNSPNWQWSLVNGRNGTAVPGKISPRTFTLAQGKHTIVIRGREIKAGLDRLILTDDRNYTPKDVTAVDDALTAYAGTATQILPADLTHNDVSLFNDVLSISAVGTSTNGTVVLSTNSISYTPKTGFVGKDTFTYTVKDESGATSTAKVTMDVQGPNAVHLGFEAEAGTMTTPMTVVTDSQVPTRKYLWSTTANQGTVSYAIDIPKTDTYVIWAKVLGATYANDSSFVSVDGQEDVFDVAEGKNSTNWIWTVVNGRGTAGTPLALNPRTLTLAQGKHTIIVRGREIQTGMDRFIVTNDRNYVPADVVTTADTVTAASGVATPISAATLLSNDIALFQDTLTIKTVSTPKNGTATLSGSTISYTPNAGFVGQDTFTYTVADGQGGTATGTVTVTVQSSTNAG
ncbi:MAG: hypothetical protein JWM68_4209 [Verrucomicrobiales bacterium]|nr:hypothetical protein [Verrucomicrobiales bacterium]